MEGLLEAGKGMWIRVTTTAVAQPIFAGAVALVLVIAAWLVARRFLRLRSTEGFQAAATAANNPVTAAIAQGDTMGGEPGGSMAGMLSKEVTTTLISSDVPGVSLSQNVCPSYQEFADKTRKEIETYTKEGATQSLLVAKASLEATEAKMKALNCASYVPPPPPPPGEGSVPPVPPAVTVAPGTRAA